VIGDGVEVMPDQIAEMTQIYGEFQQNGTRRVTVNGAEKVVVVSKIFDNEDFGYWRITVERPLRLNFQVSAERLARLETESAFVNLAVSKQRGGAALEEIEAGKALQESIKTALGSLGEQVYRDRETFDKALTKALKGVKIATPVKKAIANALAERDETAEICRDKDGNPEPDGNLRDYENVPLKEDIDEYMRREVLPHVPDAWVDESKTKIGYEIPFTRHFYEYVPPRPLAEIEREIKELEDEIRGMLEVIV
jgi:type I restriction enzyme M protein